MLFLQILEFDFVYIAIFLCAEWLCINNKTDHPMLMVEVFWRNFASKNKMFFVWSAFGAAPLNAGSIKINWLLIVLGELFIHQAS